MISKGFDFKHLTLTAVLKAEAVTSVFDFRADERALQLLLQFMGRAGRRDTQGEMIIQTSRADHPVFRMLRLPEEGDLESLMEERREFGYPPFSRIIRLLLKSPDKENWTAWQRKSQTFWGEAASGTSAVPPPLRSKKVPGNSCCSS